MLSYVIDIGRVRQYLLHVVRAEMVLPSTRADIRYLDRMRRGLLPLPVGLPPDNRSWAGYMTDGPQRHHGAGQLDASAVRPLNEAHTDVPTRIQRDTQAPQAAGLSGRLPVVWSWTT